MAAAEEDDQNLSTLDEIDAIARSVVDPKFPDAGEELDVPEKTSLKPDDTLRNALSRAVVRQAPQPCLEFKGLSNFEHVNYSSQIRRSQGYAPLPLNRSVAATSSWTMPGSLIAWPLSGTMRRSASGQARCRSQAILTGVHMS